MKRKVKKNYIVQYESHGSWSQSGNKGANGRYTKESAKQRAKIQEAKSPFGLKYRVKEIK
jgi:hypothetical protein